jgi:hypothetical protein
MALRLTVGICEQPASCRSQRALGAMHASYTGLSLELGQGSVMYAEGVARFGAGHAPGLPSCALQRCTLHGRRKVHSRQLALSLCGTADQNCILQMGS